MNGAAALVLMSGMIIVALIGWRITRWGGGGPMPRVTASDVAGVTGSTGPTGLSVSTGRPSDAGGDCGGGGSAD